MKQLKSFLAVMGRDSKGRKGGVAALVLLLGALVMAVLSGPPPAKAAEWKQGQINIFPWLASVTNLTLITNGGSMFVVPQGTGMTIVVSAGAVQATNTSTAIVGFDWTPDGTNWTTTQPFKITNTFAGTTNVFTPLQLSAAQLANVYAIKYTYLNYTGGATAVGISNIYYGYFY